MFIKLSKGNKPSKNRIIRILALIFLPTTLTYFLFAQEPRLNEKEIKNSKSIRFKNKSNKKAPKAQKTLDIKTGKGLAQKITESKEGKVNNRGITIQRYFSSEKGKLGGDVITFEKNFKADHIHSISRILTSYIKEAFEYSDKDAKTLAFYVLFYNAIHRNDAGFFSEKYSPELNSGLVKSKIGIAIEYKDWPGKTQIILPLEKNILKKGDKDVTIDELEKNVNPVIEKNPTTKNVTKKDELEKVIEEKTKDERKKIEDKKKEVAKVETKIEEEKKTTDKKIEEAKKNPATKKEEITKLEDKKKELDKKTEDIKKTKEDIKEKDEKITEKEKELEEKKNPPTKKSTDPTKVASKDTSKDSKNPTDNTKKESPKDQPKSDTTKNTDPAKKDSSTPTKDSTPKDGKTDVGTTDSKDAPKKDTATTTDPSKTDSKDSTPTKDTKKEEPVPAKKETKTTTTPTNTDTKKDDTKKPVATTTNPSKKEEPAKTNSEPAKKDSEPAKKDSATTKDDPNKKDTTERKEEPKKDGKEPTKKELAKELAEKTKELDDIKKKQQEENEKSPNVIGEKILFLQVVKYEADGHYTNDLWVLDSDNEEGLFKSPFENICGRDFVILPGGVLVVGFEGKEVDNRIHHLVLLDKETLDVIKMSEEDIFWQSEITYREGKIYVFETRDNKVYLSRFSEDLKREATSSEPVNINSDLTFNKSKIFLTSKLQNSNATSITILNKDDLKVLKTFKPSPKLRKRKK